jgi:putative transcriptional regulator
MHNTVRARRKADGLSQEDLANSIGVSRQTIIALEKGSYAPSLLLAMKLAECFGCSIHDIFTINYDKA